MAELYHVETKLREPPSRSDKGGPYNLADLLPPPVLVGLEDEAQEVRRLPESTALLRTDDRVHFQPQAQLQLGFERPNERFGVQHVCHTVFVHVREVS